MANPSPTWNTVPVIGTWRSLDGTPKEGAIKFTITDRVYAVTDDIIFPGNATLTIPLDSQGSISTLFPANDDPDVFPNGWTVKVEEKFTDNSGLSYYIEPKLANMPVGVNLRTVVVPAGTPSVPPTSIIASIEKATADTQAIADASQQSAIDAAAFAAAADASADAAAISEVNAENSANSAAASAQTVSNMVPNTRTISASTGLLGGGDLTANRSFSVNFGTAAGTVAQGNDTRITGAAQKASNLSDLANVATARTNLGLGTAATSNTTAFDAAGAAAAAQAAAIQRANHTGTQLSTTVSDFAEAVRDTMGAALVGTGVMTVTPNDAGDSITITSTATVNATDAQLRDRATHTGTQTLDTTTDTATRVAMTPAERTKLTGIDTGATANATDAQLRDRSTHTGTQATSTVTGLDTALAAKAPLASPTFTGTVSGITKAMVGLGSVDNTSDAAKPISTATQTALNAKVNAVDTELVITAPVGTAVPSGTADGTLFVEYTP